MSTERFNQDHFEPGEVELASWAKALAHPARVAILKSIAARHTCICGEIVEELPLAQSTISQHLKVLREAGLIVGETDGPRSCYCVNSRTLDTIRSEFERLLGGIKCSEDCCC